MFSWHRYLLYYANDHPDFKIEELKAIADWKQGTRSQNSVADCASQENRENDAACSSFRIRENQDVQGSPVLEVEATDDFVRCVLECSVLVKSVFRVWLRAPSIPDLLAALQSHTLGRPPTAAQTDPSERPPTAAQTDPSGRPPTAAQTDPSGRPPAAAQTDPSERPPTAAQTDPSGRPPTDAQTGLSGRPPTAAQTDPSGQPPTAAQTDPSGRPLELAALTEQFRRADDVRVDVRTYGYSLGREEKLSLTERLVLAVPLEGRLNLSAPRVRLQLFHSAPDRVVFFGHWVGDTRRAATRQTFDLRRRPFLGNTSMDPVLAALVATQARVGPGDLVMDPFVGTGGLLVAAAHRGAHVLGADIDFLLLHGRTKPSRKGLTRRAEGEGVAANLNQYGLGGRYVDVLVADAARPVWRSSLRLDAIVTDPPYGIRERSRKVKTAPRVECEGHHFPEKTAYRLDETFGDLLTLAAHHLRLGGHLVYWLPVHRPSYQPHRSVPKHPSLSLVANSEQILSTNISRRLITMRKIKEVDEVSAATVEEDGSLVNFRSLYFAPKPDTAESSSRS